MASVSGVSAVIGGIARPAQAPPYGSTISLVASKPFSLDLDELGEGGSSSSLYDRDSLTPVIVSGGRSSSQDPPKNFGKRNGLLPDRQMPPEPLHADHTDLAPSEEAQLPGADFSSTGPSYARELADRAKFVRQGGLSRLGVRGGAQSPRADASTHVEPEPRIEEGSEQLAKALVLLDVMRHIAAVSFRSRAMPEARSVPPEMQPRLYAMGPVRPLGIASKPPPTLKMVA